MSRDEVCAALGALAAHRAELADRRTIDLFADPERFARFSLRLDDLLFDFSKHKANARTMELLVALARAAKVEERRAALFAGEKVNVTEHRPALHMALRNLDGGPILVDGKDVMPEVREVRARVAAFAEAVRSGAIRGARGDVLTDIVNIGIGGSDLGPAMAARALSPFCAPHLRMHFVSNVDGADLGDTLKGLDPTKTLFIVSSKTFTTQETMTNAASARKFVADALGEAAVADHFAAVSTRLDKVAEFGIRPDRVFGFWDWVGGRYSMWSAIGLSLVIAIGAQRFEDFLRGGQDIDQHFVSAPLDRNIPVVMALLGVWRRNLWNEPAHLVIPYDRRPARFPPYLPQLDRHATGSRAGLGAAPADMATGPFLFGEPGTNGQHAFFQLLHQGTDIAPIDFLVAAEPTDADAGHHALLVANCLAQSEAMMRGRSRAEVEDILRKQGLSPEEIEKLAPHKVFAGERPTSTFMYRRLDPRTLGRLVACYEHKVFVQSVVWDINPFDQWGVELGKELCNRLAPIVQDADRPTAGLDGSTAGLIGWRRVLAN